MSVFTVVVIYILVSPTAPCQGFLPGRGLLMDSTEGGGPPLCLEEFILRQ